MIGHRNTWIVGVVVGIVIIGSFAAGFAVNAWWSRGDEPSNTAERSFSGEDTNEIEEYTRAFIQRGIVASAIEDADPLVESVAFSGSSNSLTVATGYRDRAELHNSEAASRICRSAIESDWTGSIKVIAVDRRVILDVQGDALRRRANGD